MMRLLPLALAPLRLHKGRAFAAMLAIALGVALGYAIQLINRAALGEMEQAVQTLSGEADLEIRGARAGFDEMLYARLAQRPEVAVASPVLELEVRPAGRRDALRVLGLDVFRAARIQPELLSRAGDETAREKGDTLDMLRPDTIFLSRAAADWLGAKPGDMLHLDVGLAERAWRVAGLLSGGQRYAVVDVAAAQDALSRPGLLNRIDIRLRPGSDVERVREAMQRELPAGLFAERPQTNLDRSASLTRAYRVNLNVLALVALFTGGFLVFSVQALSVVQRRAQLALLRVIGVTRRGLAALLLAEAGVLGIIGAIAGIALGHAAASLVLARFGADLGSGYFRGLQPEVHAEPDLLLIFFLLGIAAALAGSLAPALEAARAAPAQALKAGDEQQALARLRRTWPGTLCIAAGTIAVFIGPVNGLPLAGYLAIALLLTGTVLLMPRLAVAVFAVLPAGNSIAVRLARLQLRGAPGQATVSLAAIVASFSLMVAMAIMVASFRQSLDEWLMHVLPADLYVRTGFGVDTAFLAKDDQRRIAALPGVRRVDFQRNQQILLKEGLPRVALIARAIDRADPGRVLPLVGATASLRPDDIPPLWASEAATDLYGLRVGEAVLIPLAGRGERFRVAGIWRDYARQQGALVIERERYVALTGDVQATEAAIQLVPGAHVSEMKEAIRRALSGGDKLEFGEPGELRAASLGIFDRTFAVTYALEAAAVLIGLFGLSTSFGALVLSRRREFGMLRHVGMTRRQIAAMIAHEGLLVSGLGLAAGLALGWMVSLILVHVVNRQSFHWGMDIHMPWAKLAVLAFALLVLAVLTALVSARQALSGDAVRAVREDW